MKDQNLFFKQIEGIPDKKGLEELLTLYTSVFNDAITEFFLERIQTKEKVFSIIAYYNNNPVGFKIGYQYNSNTFYSWVGGVLPQYRKKGIASQLAKLQENWALQNGFKKLRTKSMNKFKPMLILNLKNGFDIIQVYTNEKGQTKIVFEKSI
ncbi:MULTISPECIES: GNAT family N-acetyltransferase [unclassified Tenacibaculum]|uniref:GNAT family N-acetyltransferase n=1 Tax=unclassified Tenacibaculum TaxID=2635139 RepID=UPI001F26F673|nr:MULTISPECIES: GNAT family N-acetyltransferase [unclassified Tenacibaculum]MCF2874733.1 GNAT family N-acetyltransferase [Tenacibaculum sp. Cn5-1]MCF2934201.1 GNAT family N-acetyltransferase [Tenacibaculum sp. Cn5-34]MCG7510411.1 GNAT family N-acetyltransferase [Tenacibaculum sp. Cn5-46]